MALTDHRRAALTPRLIDSLYTEAMVLADEARSYFDGPAEQDRAALPPVLRVSFACESLRVTTRLMHVIAWLLTQRALAKGELTSVEAHQPERRLGDPVLSDHALVEQFPDTARHMIRASEDLFDRVHRLDLAGEATAPRPSPALSLMSRLERSF